MRIEIQATEDGDDLLLPLSHPASLPLQHGWISLQAMLYLFGFLKCFWEINVVCKFCLFIFVVVVILHDAHDRQKKSFTLPAVGNLCSMSVTPLCSQHNMISFCFGVTTLCNLI